MRRTKLTLFIIGLILVISTINTDWTGTADPIRSFLRASTRTSFSLLIVLFAFYFFSIVYIKSLEWHMGRIGIHLKITYGANPTKKKTAYGRLASFDYPGGADSLSRLMQMPPDKFKRTLLTSYAGAFCFLSLFWLGGYFLLLQSPVVWDINLPKLWLIAFIAYLAAMFIPYYVQTPLGLIASGGLIFYRIFKCTESWKQDFLSADPSVQATILIKNRAYEQALESLVLTHNQFPNSLSIRLTTVDALTNLLELDEALTEAELLDREDLYREQRVVIDYCLGIIYWLKSPFGQPLTALARMEAACKSAPRNEDIATSHACLLIESGRMLDGFHVLTKIFDPADSDFANSHTPLAALYLAYCWWLQNNPDMSNQYLKLFEDRIGQLSLIDVRFYQRMCLMNNNFGRGFQTGTKDPLPDDRQLAVDV